MNVLFKYATRSRPELFKRGLESIINNCTGKYHILVSIDEDDESMNNEKMLTYIYSSLHTSVKRGVSKNKIDAINRDVNDFTERMYDWDILVNMSDDMVFTQKGFDDDIRGCMSFYGALINLDQCLHFPDGNRSDLITMAIMGRAYYDRFGYIYHPDYKSLYCDNEMTDVAKTLNCYRYCDLQIFEHLHPAYSRHGAIFDAQYQHTESFMNEDRMTYLKRKSINFGL